MSLIEIRLPLAGARSRLLKLPLLSKVARLQVYFPITHYTLLHQATRGERRNSLRERRDILVSVCDSQRFFYIILINFNL